MLKSSTVEALQSIIQIASDRYNKDRFNACKYIIDKAYGANTAFLLDGTEDTAPTVIRIVLPGLSPRRIPKTALITKPVCTSRPKLLSKSSTF